ncbi:MAG: vacuolar-type H+-ATPase subunit H, partial [Porcipelethomonas sp.]
IDDILDEMDDVLDKAKPFPFAGDKKVANTDRLRDLVDDVRLHMPSEIKEARGVVFDKERILNEAREKADLIIRDAEKRAAAMVMKDTIVEEAKAKALDILKQAKANAAKITRDANEYTENILSKTEKLMAAVLQDVRKTKNSMRDKK